MPISDQVIELETKKTGRNVLFIVLIALLAAASVVFAVLWVVKAPAVDPPSIETITVSHSDMYKLPDDENSGIPKFALSPRCEYTVTFDMALKANTLEDEVNYILNVRTEPEGMIDVTNGYANEATKQYVVTFTVKASAQKNFQIIAESEYAQKADRTVAATFQVSLSDTAYVASFDVPANGNGVKTLRDNNGTGDVMELVPQTGKNTATELHYKLKNPLPYFGEASAVFYSLPFEQLGKQGTDDKNGAYEKVPSYEINGHHFDEVQVFAANGEDVSTANYKSIDFGGGEGVLRQIRYTGVAGRDYFRNGLRFCADEKGMSGGTGTSTLKIVANAYNGAPEQYTVFVEITFVTKDLLGKITEIRFVNPYTEKAEVNKDNRYEMDWYIDDNNRTISLDDRIQAVRGKEDGKEVIESGADLHWGDGDLSAYVSDKDGNRRESDPLIQLAQGKCAVTFRTYPMNTAGVAYVTVRDTDRDGFAAKCIIELHIRISVRAVKDGADLNATPGKSASVDITGVYAGNTVRKDIRYDCGTYRPTDENKDDLAKSINTFSKAEYLTDEVGADKKVRYRKPAFNAKGELANADDTVYLTGLARDYTVTPATKQSGDTWVFGSTLSFAVGKNVATGEYRIALTLTPQSLVLPTAENKLTHSMPAEGIRVEFVVHVVRLAQKIGVQEIAPDNADRHTVWEIGEDSTMLQIAAGTGTGDGDKKYTSFSLYDILTFADDEGSIQNDEETRRDNYGQLHVDCGTAQITDVFLGQNVTQATGNIYNDARFCVPANADNAPNVTVTLTFENDKGEVTNRYTITVRYYWAVEKVECDATVHTISYDASTVGTNGFLLNNIQNDKVTAYSRVGDETSAIASANKLKNTDDQQSTDDLQMDIVVLRGGDAIRNAAKLPKREVKIGSETYIYFFRSIADETEISDINNAYYRAQKSHDGSSLWQGWDITVLRDIFSVSVGLGWDCHSLRLYYSYGEELVTTVDGVIRIAEGKENLVTFSNYQLVRKFDELRFYEKEVKEDKYTDAIGDNTILSSSENGTPGKIIASSGASFHVYPVGVVKLNDGSEYLIANNDSKYKCNAIELSFSEDSSGYDSANIEGFNLVTITCTTEAEAKVTLKFHESNTNKLIYLSISVNNQAAPITDITLYWDSAYSRPVGDNDSRLLFTNRAPDTLTVYYTVTYRTFDGTEKGLEAFVLSVGNGLTVSDKSPLPAFSTNSIKAGDQLIYKGYATLTATENAADTSFSVRSNPEHCAASLALQVSTVLEEAAVTVTDRYGATVHIADTETESVAFKYDVAGSRENSRDLSFILSPATFDAANLSYRAVWNVRSGDASGIRGMFYDENGAEYASATGKNIAGYRVYFGNTPLQATLTLYIDEKIADSTVTHTFTVQLTVDSTVARMQANYGGQSLANDGNIVMAVGQPSISGVTVTLFAYTSGNETIEKDISVAVGTPDVLAVTKNNNTLTFTPKAAGESTVTVTADGQTFVFTVKVIAPSIALAFTDGNERNVFADGNVTLPFTCAFDPALPEGVEGDAFAFTVDGVAADTLGWLTVTRNSQGRYTLTVQKSALTAALLGEHTLTVTSAVMGVTVTQQATFTLAFTGYEPELTLTRTDGVSADGAIDKAALSKYRFTLANLPTGYGENIVSVSFTSDALLLSASGTVASVTDLVAGFAGLSGQTTVTVTVFGQTYTDTLTFTLCDTNSIRGELYYYNGEANLNNLLGDDGSLRTDLSTSAPSDIGYTDPADAYRVILIVDYSGLPQAATLTVGDFVVNLYETAKLTAGTPVLLHMQGAPYYYYAVQYRIDTTGDVTFDVRTVPLNGKEYAVQALTASFDAVAPVFTWQKETQTVTKVVLDPGATERVTVGKNDYKGNFTYTYAWANADEQDTDSTSDKILRVRKNGNTLDFTAAVGLGGCNTSLTVAVTVTSGAFAGATYTLTLPVTVTRYAAPVASSRSVWLTGAGEKADIRSYISVQADAHDTLFAYSVSNATVATPAVGNITGTQFTASNAGTTKIGYTVTVTAGYYAGYTFTVDAQDGVTVTVAPATTLTAASNNVVAGNTLTLIPSAGDATVESVRYTLSNAAAGMIAGNVFTADRNFAGSVTVTAYFDALSYNASKGEGKAATCTFTVTAIPAPVINITNNGLTYTVSADVEVTAAHAVLAGSEQLISVTKGGDGKTFTVTKLPSKTGGTAVFTISVTVTDSRYAGTPYASTKTYTYTVTVDPIDAPDISIDTAIDANGLGTYTVQPNGVEITSECKILSGDDLIGVSKNGNAFTVSAKDKTLGGKAVIEISYTVTDSRYADTVYATTTKQTYTVTVPTLVAPVITVDEPDNENGLGDYIVNSNGTAVNVTYTVLSGEDLITVMKSGNTVNVAAKDKALGGKAAVKITVEVTDSRFTGTVYATTTDYVYTVTVPTLAKPNISVTAPVAANGLGVYTVNNNGTTVEITYTVLSGNELIAVTKNGNTVTVSAKQNTLGGKAVVKISVKVTDSHYAGTVYATTTDYVYTVTTTAAAKPTEDDVSVIPANNAEKTGGTVTVATTASGYSVASVAYACDGAYLSFTGNAYTFLKKESAQKSISVTATVVLSGAPYGDVAIEKPFTVVIPAIGQKPAIDASKITYDLTKAGNGNSEYTGHFIVAADIGDFAVLAYVPQSAGLVMGNNGTFTYTAGAGNVVVTVLYRITAGDYAGETDTTTVTVTIPALPTLSAAVANGTITVTGSTATLGDYDTALVKIDEAGDNVWNYTFIKGVGAQDILLTFTATVADGVYAGYTISTSVTLSANEVVPSARFDGDNMCVVAENVPANATVTYASDNNKVKVDENGAISTDETASGEYGAAVTVTVTVQSGEYAGCEYTLTVPVTVTVPEQTTDTTENP